MARIANAERKVAPIVETSTTHVDERKVIVDRLRSEDPSYFYGFHRHNVTDFDLQRGGFEKVTDGNGNLLHHNGDPVVRRPLELHNQLKNKRQNESYEMVKDRLVGADRDGKLTQVAQKKVPKVVKTEY